MKKSKGDAQLRERFGHENELSQIIAPLGGFLRKMLFAERTDILKIL